MRMRQTQEQEWAPHWETIDGIVYMTETGGTKGGDRQQVGTKMPDLDPDLYKDTDVTWGHTEAGAVKARGSGDADFIQGDKDHNNLIHGMGGNDFLTGGMVRDNLFGGTGADHVNGGGGDDFVHGGDGNDYVRGGDGSDVVNGGTGNDRVSGGGGNDTLYGGDGQDFLYGGHGTDIMYGGDGHDIFYLKQVGQFETGRFDQIIAEADSIKDFQQGQDKIRINKYTDVAYQNVTVGDHDFTVIFNNAGDKGGVYGIIDNQDVDLKTTDFKNARSVTEIDAVTFDSWDDVGATLFDEALTTEIGIY